MTPFPPYPVFQHPPDHANEAPARVGVALRFLETLHDCQVGYWVPGDPPGEVEGRELLPVEEEARAAALNMLQDYFNGHLEPTGWEITVAGLDRPEGVAGKCQHCQQDSVFMLKRGK